MNYLATFIFVAILKQPYFSKFSLKIEVQIQNKNTLILQSFSNASCGKSIMWIGNLLLY